MDRKIHCSSISVNVFESRMAELQGMRRIACPHCGKERYYDVRKALEAGAVEAMGGCHAHGGGCGEHFSFTLSELG